MNLNKYDASSVDSIIKFATKLEGQTLRTACNVTSSEFHMDDKGGFGKMVERCYFKYEPNSSENPDFKVTGLELKCSPLKILKNGEFRSKEKLIMNIIDYMEVHKETFDKSAFLRKNSHLLLVFYLHDKNLDLVDYPVKLVANWQYTRDDLEIIERDWETITQKIRNGQAHELTESDTLCLGATVKGSIALKSFRKQPFNVAEAKQRAYSLKQCYVNHIIWSIAQEKSFKETFGKSLEGYRKTWSNKGRI